MKTYSQKQSEVARNWYVVDASANTLGRVSTVIARYLTGKHKPSYSPNIDDGDHIVVLNADKIKVTGGKLLEKKYYRHSGYPGNLKESTLKDKLEMNPEFVITNAVKGMLPKNKLQTERMKRLHVYVGESHTHEGQKPTTLEVK